MLRQCVHRSVPVLLGNTWHLQERSDAAEFLRWIRTLRRLLQWHERYLHVAGQFDDVRNSHLPESNHGTATRDLQRQRNLPYWRPESLCDQPGLLRRGRLRLPDRHVRHYLSNVRERTTLLRRGLRVRRNLVCGRLLQRHHVRPRCQPDDINVRRRRQRRLQDVRFAGLRQRRVHGKLRARGILQRLERVHHLRHLQQQRRLLWNIKGKR